MIRRTSVFNTQQIDHPYDDTDTMNQRLFLHLVDLTDSPNLNRMVEKTTPGETYNSGAPSHIKVSSDIPENSADDVASAAAVKTERSVDPKAIVKSSRYIRR